MSRIVGIDFGTTKTVAAIFDGRHSVVIPDRRGRQHIPSVVLVSPEQEFFVGWEAKDHHSRYESEFISINSIKRALGHQKEKSWGWLKAHPQAVAALIFGRLKIELEDHFGEKISKAVIAIPAHFDINQRWAVKQSAEVAGFQVVRMLNEATAVALAYHVKNPKSDATILVLDFGGGTLDASVLEIWDGGCEVKATAGDGQLGGDDFDQIIMDHILDVTRERHTDFKQWDPFQEAVVREAATQAKLELSAGQFSQIYLPGLIQIAAQSHPLNLTLDRDTFYQLSQKLFDRTEAVILKVLKDAGRTHTSIDATVLIGGTSRIPAVREIARKVLKKEPVTGVDRETGVAEGAAVLASVLDGRSDVFLLDSYPNSLSISTMGGVATRIVERNTSIPVRRSEIVTTNKDNQTSVEVEVYEGESQLVADNALVGSVALVGIPPAPRGIPQIEVTFDIDANGILNVSASDLSTGKRATATMTAPSRLSTEQLGIIKGVVDMEMEKVLDRLAHEAAIAEEAAIKSETLKWAEAIKGLLTERRSDLGERQVSILEGGCQLVGDYHEREASADDFRNLLASLKLEFDHALADFISRSIMAIVNDEGLYAWTDAAVGNLDEDDSILHSMRAFEAQYQELALKIVDDLKKASGIEEVCDRAFAELQHSTGGKHCLALVLSHFEGRAPLDLEKIAEPSSPDPIARPLLILLLFRELSRDKSKQRRMAAARALSNINEAQYLLPLLNRLRGEADEVTEELQECLRRIPSEAWRTCFESIDPELRSGYLSRPFTRARFRDALLEMLLVEDTDEQQEILAALTEVADDIYAPALLDALNHVGDDDMRARIISLLPASQDQEVAHTLIELLLDEGAQTREAAGAALERCEDLLEPETKKFIKITKAVVEHGWPPSLAQRFFLSGYVKRHRELETFIERLKGERRN